MLPDKGDLDCARRRCFREALEASRETLGDHQHPDTPSQSTALAGCCATRALGAEALLSGGSRDEPRDARRPAPGHARLDLLSRPSQATPRVRHLKRFV